MNKEYIFSEIDIASINRVQLMRTIKAEHGYYGSINLTKDDLKKFKENFDLNKRRVDLAVDFSHRSDLEAAGWIKEITLENNDSELWIEVEWTKAAQDKILDKQYRYLSADFSMKYLDDETGEMIGQVLHGAGLTNRPFIKGMNPILSEMNSVELSAEQLKAIREILNPAQVQQTNVKENTMDFDDVLKAISDATDEQKAQLADALGLKEVKEDVQLSDELLTLKAENEKLKKDGSFNKLLSEGKAVEAQRQAYLDGDMDKFASLKADVNLNEHGSSANEGAENEPKTPEAAAAKLSEIALGIEKETGLTFSDALSKAIRENDKLYALADQA
jgi:phage I-like protein